MPTELPAIVEQYVEQAKAQRSSMTREQYSEFLQNLAYRFEIECWESGPTDPETGHAWGCGCDHCKAVKQISF